MTAQEVYDEIVGSIPGARVKKMFGAQGLIVNDGPVAASLYKNGCMTFKLPQSRIAQLLENPNIRLFEPRAGMTMKDWVEVPFEESAQWRQLVEEALEYVLE